MDVLHFSPDIFHDAKHFFRDQEWPSHPGRSPVAHLPL